MKSTAAKTGKASIPTKKSVARCGTAGININSLYRTHWLHVLRFVKRYVRNQEDAEDVAQNTFMEALRCAESFSGMSKPSTWLFGIALNLARNQVRRNCADRFEDFDEDLVEAIADDNSDPAYLIELREVAAKVQVMLAQLAPTIRDTFESVLEGESTYEEAAVEMHVPIGTVRSRVSRVRASIRAEFHV